MALTSGRNTFKIYLHIFLSRAE